jgi:hypothetical protein
MAWRQCQALNPYLRLDAYRAQILGKTPSSAEIASTPREGFEYELSQALCRWRYGIFTPTSGIRVLQN